MANFEIAHEKTSSIEGGYVNDPTDNGKETYRGISRKYFPDWKGWEIIDQYKENTTLKRNQYINNPDLDVLVDDFYKQHFWDSIKLGSINYQELANEMFDTAVNMGLKTSVKFLQEALNLLNKNEKSYQDLKVDGIIGNRTIGIANSFQNYSALLKTMNGLQFMKYVRICKNKPEQEKFFLGWLKRI